MSHLMRAASCLLACPIAAQAQEVPSLPAVAAAVVEKTERPLHDVPASILLLDGQEIERAGISAMETLEARVPGLSFQPFGMAGVNSPVLRGLTANFNTLSSSTLLLVDDVPTLTAQGFDHGFEDIQHVEVLRGPQSTLYGRNAEAGVIAIHSQPLEGAPRAQLTSEAGSRNRRALRFALARPLVEDRLYASISGAWMKQGGFVHNLHHGKKDDERQRQRLNLALRWLPASGTQATLRYTRQMHDDGAAPWGTPAATRRQVASGTAGWNRSRGHTAAFTLEHQFTPTLRLYAITALNQWRDRVMQDSDFQPQEMLYIGRNHRFHTLSQELRLHGSLGRADGLLGIYADRSDNHLHSISHNARFGHGDWRARQKNHTAALFTHWSMPLAERWSLDAGLRMERLAIHLLPPDAGSEKRHWTPVSPKLALQYQFSPRQQSYVSASRGVRTGSFNTLSPSLGYLPIAPEKLWSYEWGLKGRSSNGRMHYTLAAYWMDIDDMQVMQMPMPGSIYITNAATAQSKGMELELQWRINRQWQWQAGIAYNRTRFDRFIDGSIDYSGKHNPFAPAFTGHMSVHYRSDNGWYAQVGVRSSSKVYLDAANQYQRNGYGQIDAASGFARNGLDISLYAKNLNNQTFDAVGYQNGFVTVYSPPRELGLRLTWRFA